MLASLSPVCGRAAARLSIFTASTRQGEGTASVKGESRLARASRWGLGRVAGPGSTTVIVRWTWGAAA